MKMKKTISLVCTSLVCLLVLVGVAAAQRAADAAPAAQVPTNNPEPMTLAALLGGAALAGGIAYRLRKRAR